MAQEEVFLNSLRSREEEDWEEKHLSKQVIHLAQIFRHQIELSECSIEAGKYLFKRNNKHQLSLTNYSLLPVSQPAQIE